MAKTLIFFAEKMCIAKATHIFAAKILMYLNVNNFVIKDQGPVFQS